MEVIQNIVEYYDELYPVSENQTAFFHKLITEYPEPAKILRIGCGTGNFEHQLAKQGIDVTGLENSTDLLESANRKRRNQLMSIRFFKMSTIDMTRFLGKGFYDIIFTLDGRILLIHDHTLMRKFFCDCRQLLAKNGTFVIQMPNLALYTSAPMAKLPNRESIRARLFTQIWTADDGSKAVQQDLETGNGKILPVLDKTPVYPLKKDEITAFAKEAGFSECEFYSDYDKSPFTEQSPNLLAVIK